ncbi:MAG: hypothetical protein IPI49_11825 [Myxococcales bacterium]|nr:hypothetical protein [Myxococcales bacterium]
MSSITSSATSSITSSATSSANRSSILTLGVTVGLTFGLIFGALTGCADEPPLRLRYKLTAGAAQKCPAACESVDMYCASVLSIRIVDPREPDKALATVCDRLEASPSLCSISRVRLPSDVRLPERRLAVQVALYNADHVPKVNGKLACPADQPFDGNNFAAPSEYQPAVAGVGYYDPGDDETVVELGCADLTVINTPVCRGQDRVRITASVEDFDNGAHLPPALADRMELSIGEPSPRINPVTQQPEYVLPIDATRDLARVPETIRPAWTAEVSLRFAEAACIEVFEDAAQTTKSLSCKQVTVGDTAVDLPAVRLSRQTLEDVIKALGKTSFPEDGLVVGKVVDRVGNPLKNVAVRPSTGTVQYLSTGRDGLIGDVTSETGIFVSRDAPFNSSWSAAGTSGGYGGLVVGRVTIVMLQADVSP